MATLIRTYQDLIVWQKSMDLALIVLRLAARLKGARSYVLADQLERSAISIPSNLAEGHGRRSRAEFRRYVAVANASLRELETQLSS
ncbi:MAG: four helix bundle protein [Gemmatimonadales bacterium]